jgi:hypothetical protein
VIGSWPAQQFAHTCPREWRECRSGLGMYGRKWYWLLLWWTWKWPFCYGRNALKRTHQWEWSQLGESVPFQSSWSPVKQWH